MRSPGGGTLATAQRPAQARREHLPGPIASACDAGSIDGTRLGPHGRHGWREPQAKQAGGTFALPSTHLQFSINAQSVLNAVLNPILNSFSEGFAAYAPATLKYKQ